jgi:predicted nucleic acid-binding protein
VTGEPEEASEASRTSETGTRVSADTSVLVRYFVQDHPARGPAAQRLLDGEQTISVSLVALAETAFVLSRNYAVPREEVVDNLVGLLRKRNVEVLGVHKSLAAAALLACRPSGRVSFADALIGADARAHGVLALYTFDEQFPADGLSLRAPE